MRIETVRPRRLVQGAFSPLLLLQDKERSLTWSKQGLSGRTLRRLPVLAHAKHIGGNRATLEHWIEGMIKTVKEEGDQLALVNE